MSTAGLINRYVWFVTTIYNRGPITLEEIDINACDMASLYHDHFNSPKYKFKVYKK